MRLGAEPAAGSGPLEPSLPYEPALASNVQTTDVMDITARWNRGLYDGERLESDSGVTRRVLRFVGWLAVSVFGLAGVAAALLAGLSAVDDGASDEAGLSLLAGAICAGLLAVSAGVLWVLRRTARGPSATAAGPAIARFV